MGIFEALMLTCFGISWPISIIKTLRTKAVTGKSPLFIWVIIAGYIFGIIHKLITPDWVIYLYAINLVAVTADLILYYRYAGREPPAGKST